MNPDSLKGTSARFSVESVPDFLSNPLSSESPGGFRFRIPGRTATASAGRSRGACSKLPRSRPPPAGEFDVRKRDGPPNQKNAKRVGGTRGVELGGRWGWILWRILPRGHPRWHNLPKTPAWVALASKKGGCKLAIQRISNAPIQTCT